MSESIDPLLRDLIGWLGVDGRPYRDVMDAWRTSCPRLPVWEEANDRGLIARMRRDGVDLVMRTDLGLAFLCAPGGQAARPARRSAKDSQAR